jgi:hypothetical protein
MRAQVARECKRTLCAFVRLSIHIAVKTPTEFVNQLSEAKRLQSLGEAMLITRLLSEVTPSLPFLFLPAVSEASTWNPPVFSLICY